MDTYTELLTKQFSELTMEEVRAHAQKYQDKSSREAQNSEMLIQCLKASITRTVYNKVYLQMSKYIIYRKRTMEPTLTNTESTLTNTESVGTVTDTS
jgi:hypothetical protein